MNRRTFVKLFAGAVVASCVVLKWLAQVADSCKTIFAGKTDRYPGRIVPIEDVSGQAKWSG